MPDDVELAVVVAVEENRPVGDAEITAILDAVVVCIDPDADEGVRLARSQGRARTSRAESGLGLMDTSRRSVVGHVSVIAWVCR